MKTLSKEELEALGEKELTALYQEVTEKFDTKQKLVTRVQSLLHKKIVLKQKRIANYENELQTLRTRFPHIQHSSKKQDFDDNPQFLRESIQKHTTTLLNLQTQQIQLKKELKELDMKFAKLQAQEKFVQQEVDDLIKESNELDQDMGDSSEKMQLAVITSEYQTTHDLLDTITLEIEHLHKKLHDRS
jgi:predicted  nucleic acid-binding Zn-ribbon protein